MANISLKALKNPTGECRRTGLWIFWTLNMVLNLVHMVLSFATSQKLITSLSSMNLMSFSNHAWQAPIAACILGGLMVLIFNILSCIILIRKSVNKSGPGGCDSKVREPPQRGLPAPGHHPCLPVVVTVCTLRAGFGYGLIMSWSFCMSFFLLMCALIMDGFSNTVTGVLQTQGSWSKVWSGAYLGTIAFDYICCIMFLIMFLGLVIFQGGISKSVGLYDSSADEKRRLQMAMYTSAPSARMDAGPPLGEGQGAQQI